MTTSKFETLKLEIDEMKALQKISDAEKEDSQKAMLVYMQLIQKELQLISGKFDSLDERTKKIEEIITVIVSTKKGIIWLTKAIGIVASLIAAILTLGEIFKKP